MPKAESRFCSTDELAAWEGRAKPGIELIYYEGPSLGREVSPDRIGKRPTDLTADTINRVRTLYNLGRVVLVQRRLSHGRTSTFAYIATFLDKPIKVSAEHRLIDVIAFKEAA